MTEPVTLDEAKLFLKVDLNDEDDLIGQLIIAARIDIENESGYALVDATIVKTLDTWPEVIELERYPVKSVTSIQYYNGTATLVTLDPTLYRVDLLRPRVRIETAWGTVWPTPMSIIGTIVVTYVVGVTTIPLNLKAALYRRLSELYGTRNTADSTQLRSFLLPSSRMVRM